MGQQSHPIKIGDYIVQKVNIQLTHFLLNFASNELLFLSFSDFLHKNAEKAYFDQHLECP